MASAYRWKCDTKIYHAANVRELCEQLPKVGHPSSDDATFIIKSHTAWKVCSWTIWSLLGWKRNKPQAWAVCTEYVDAGESQACMNPCREPEANIEEPCKHPKTKAYFAGGSEYFIACEVCGKDLSQ